MLRIMRDMEGYTIGATDGVIGQVKDFYFDDESWVIRYLVVETGAWLSSRRVLISPIAIGEPNWSEKILPVSTTREQVKNSPDIDTNKPVWRQHEMGYLGYYGYPYCWGGSGLWGAASFPHLLLSTPGYGGTAAEYRRTQAQNARAQVEAEAKQHQGDDPHLRSGNTIMHYYVHATDGDIGHVGGPIVDEKTWAIRYLIVNTSNWWLGHEVLIAPKWITDFDWDNCKVSVGMTRMSVKVASPYDSSLILNREHEARVHSHYGHLGYWPRETQMDADTSKRHSERDAAEQKGGISQP